MAKRKIIIFIKIYVFFHNFLEIVDIYIQMKAKEVLKILNITHRTLCTYGKKRGT